MSSHLSEIESKMVGFMETKIADLSTSVQQIKMSQSNLTDQLKLSNLTARLDGLEKRQEEVIKLLSNLRNELAGISSGMARRDSLMIGSGLHAVRRDSLMFDASSRRGSCIISTDALVGKGNTIPVMEVEPWCPTPQVQQMIDRLLERQFMLSPWMREKRLRNQLRLVLKDHLDAGPQRRSTVTKIVHDAHQVYPVWRGQIKDAMFDSWEKVQELGFNQAAEIIFKQFKKPRFPDELESTVMYAEHMIEVGQYLRRKASERAEKAGKPASSQGSITNSKFWYEVRKKINEILETKKESGWRNGSSGQVDKDDSDGDDESYHSPREDSDETLECVEKKIGKLEKRGLSSDSGVDFA